MSAEGNLYNPCLFRPISDPDAVASFRASLPHGILSALNDIESGTTTSSVGDPSSSSSSSSRPLSISPKSAYSPIALVTKQYLAIVKGLETQTATSAIKAHLFKLWKPIFDSGRHLDLRNALSACATGQGKTWRERVDEFDALAARMAERIELDWREGRLDVDPNASIDELDAQDEEEKKRWEDGSAPDFSRPLLPLPYSHCRPNRRSAPATTTTTTSAIGDSVLSEKRSADVAMPAGAFGESCSDLSIYND
jgi:hypothetical protein